METHPSLAETQVEPFKPSVAQLAFPLGGMARKKRASGDEAQGIVAKYLPNDWVSLQLSNSQRCIYVHVSNLVLLSPAPEKPTQPPNGVTTAETVSKAADSQRGGSQSSYNLVQQELAPEPPKSIQEQIPMGAKVKRMDGRSEGTVVRHCPGGIVVFRVNASGDCDTGYASKLILIE